MPDASDFGQGSNDHDPHDQGRHADWAGAFVALPLEMPAADSWQRLQARVPAAPSRQRTRWPLWLATAASLALVVAIPLRMQSTTTTTTTTPPSITVPSPTNSSTAATAQEVIDHDVELASVASVPVPSGDMRTTARKVLPTLATTARVRKPRRDRYVDPSQRPIRTAAEPADTTRVASAETIDAPATGIDHDSLEPLYAQSAQLEGLLSLARDDRVSTGSAAALTDILNRQVADIDAVLAQPGLSLQDRDDLWRNRVDTLRQLVGIETTQRLYSARGQQYEAAMVSID